MSEKSRNKKYLIIVFTCIFVCMMVLGGYYFFMHNKSYKNQAMECVDGGFNA